MKPFHVDFFEDFESFLKLCELLSKQPEPPPVFRAEGRATGHHFFMATPLYRAHFHTLVQDADALARRIESEGSLHVIRATVRAWGRESPTFPARFDVSNLYPEDLE